LTASPKKTEGDCSLRPFVESDTKELAGGIDRNRDFLGKTMDWPDHYCSECDFVFHKTSNLALFHR
jgi:hypothetical protein